MRYKLIGILILGFWFPDVYAQATLPVINQEIIHYVNGVIGNR